MNHVRTFLPADGAEKRGTYRLTKKNLRNLREFLLQNHCSGVAFLLQKHCCFYCWKLCNMFNMSMINEERRGYQNVQKSSSLRTEILRHEKTKIRNPVELRWRATTKRFSRGLNKQRTLLNHFGVSSRVRLRQAQAAQ